MSEEALERNLQIEICSNSVTLPVSYSSRGNIWWIFLDEDQRPMYTGKEIEAFSAELPNAITFENINLELLPVPKFDKKAKQYLDDSEPFEKTRRFWGPVTIEDVVLEVKFRLTVKKNGKWNFSARVHPEKPIAGAAARRVYDSSDPSPLKEIIDSLNDDESTDT